MLRGLKFVAFTICQICEIFTLPLCQVNPVGDIAKHNYTTVRPNHADVKSESSKV